MVVERVEVVVVVLAVATPYDSLFIVSLPSQLVLRFLYAAKHVLMNFRVKVAVCPVSGPPNDPSLFTKRAPTLGTDVFKTTVICETSNPPGTIV
jgi:hypothetical protein